MTRTETARNRYIIRREIMPRYAVHGSQAARWCVCDTWDDEQPVGFGIRKYDARGIAFYLNTQNRISPLKPHQPTEPYWEWRQPGDYPGVTFPMCVRADHQRSLVGPYRYSSDRVARCR
jgi:hypothetical protein